jgi:hypothetical protein
MSPAAADLSALGLYVIAALPFAWLAARPGSARWLVPLTVVVIVAIAESQTGIFRQNTLASTDVDQLTQSESPENRCRKVFDILLKSGVILDRPERGRLLVRGAAWDRLPETMQNAITSCVVVPGPLTSQETGPEVIRR